VAELAVVAALVEHRLYQVVQVAELVMVDLVAAQRAD
jgi:hypothetical protein